MRRMGTGWGPGLGLWLLVTAAYALPASQAGFIWDDDSYLTDNATLRAPDALRRIWTPWPPSTPQYYPLVFTGFWAESRLWGLDPLGYHLDNVLLHALNAVLLWRVLRLLGLPGAWFAAALFGLHPVHVESVAWITERKNVLSGTFYLSAMLAYWRFSQGPPRDEAPPGIRPAGLDEVPGSAPPRPRRGPWAWYGLALLLFLGALFSKTVSCSLPAALALLLWWKCGRIPRRDAIALAPMFALGLAMGLTTAWLEKVHVGAVGESWSLSGAQRLLIAGRAVWFYPGKLLLPVGLAFIYPRWRVDPGVGWQWLFPIGAAAALLALAAARRRIGRGPLVAALLFVGTLAPSLGFFDIYPFRYSFVADHFQYLASASALAAVGALAARASEGLGPNGRRAGPAIAGAVLALLGVLTFARACAFHDEETLWEATLRTNPDAGIAHNNLGKIRIERGELEPAQRHFREAVRLSPGSVEAHNNLGMILERQGRLDEAMELLDAAIRLDPNYWQSHYNLGLVRREQGRHAEAAREFTEVTRLRPSYAAAFAELGMVRVEMGDADEAAAEFGRAARVAASGPIDGYNADVLGEAAWMLATTPSRRSRDGRTALRLARLASEARGHRDPTVLYTMAVAYADLGRFDDAIARAREALALAEAGRKAELAARIRRSIQTMEDRRSVVRD